MARVVVITREGRVRQVELAGSATTIGRSARSDIVIHGPLVSRAHALVSASRGAFSVRDLDSSNGTFVNGLKVHRQQLRHEDVIRVGDCELRFLDSGFQTEVTQPMGLARA